MVTHAGQVSTVLPTMQKAQGMSCVISGAPGMLQQAQILRPQQHELAHI